MSEVIKHEPRSRRWTREAYYKMAEAGIISPEVRVELVEGSIGEISPQKSTHRTAISLLNGVLPEAIGHRDKTIG
jgi:hypothetical protein